MGTHDDGDRLASHGGSRFDDDLQSGATPDTRELLGAPKPGRCPGGQDQDMKLGSAACGTRIGQGISTIGQEAGFYGNAFRRTSRQRVVAE